MDELIVRAIGDRKIEGYGIVFYDANKPGTEYHMFDNVYERISRQAIGEIPEGIIFTMNHTYSNPLGIHPDNMQLTVDEIGVKYTVDLFDSASSRVLMQRVKAGKIKGSSFTAMAQSTWSKENGKDIRTISKITDLQELSAVENPAYTMTQAKIRSIENERKEWVETEKRIFEARQLLKIK